MSDGDPQRDPYARLRQVRDEIDGVLEGDHDELDAENIEGVIFCLSDGDQSLARAVQEPGSEAPAPLITMLGELLDGLGQANGFPPAAIAQRALGVMAASKGHEGYSQRRLDPEEDGA